MGSEMCIRDRSDLSEELDDLDHDLSDLSEELDDLDHDLSDLSAVWNIYMPALSNRPDFFFSPFFMHSIYTYRVELDPCSIYPSITDTGTRSRTQLAKILFAGRCLRTPSDQNDQDRRKASPEIC